MSKIKKRKLKKFLKELTFVPAPLSTNKGRLERTPFRLYSKKDRRNKGRMTAVIYHPEIYPYEFTWVDPWFTFGDGLRNDKDKTHIRNRFMFGRNWGEDHKIEENNIRLRKYAKIRKARKEKLRNKYGRKIKPE
jgi:hypothetical protein